MHVYSPYIRCNDYYNHFRLIEIRKLCKIVIDLCLQIVDWSSQWLKHDNNVVMVVCISISKFLIDFF